MWPFSSSHSSTVVEEPSTETEKPYVQHEPAVFPSSGPAHEPRIAGEELKEYMRVCAEIGIDSCTDLTREKLRVCLREENIQIFNEKQVVRYLDEKLGNDWEWRGLRQQDVKHLANFHIDVEGVRKVEFSDEPYRGAVPLPVLLTVQKIKKAVPEVFFYVSAPKDEDGDPFLMVTNRWLNSYIVERWDEPNFRER